jgi:hypothetical protein
MRLVACGEVRRKDIRLVYVAYGENKGKEIRIIRRVP